MAAVESKVKVLRFGIAGLGVAAGQNREVPVPKTIRGREAELDELYRAVVDDGPSSTMGSGGRRPWRSFSVSCNLLVSDARSSWSTRCPTPSDLGPGGRQKWGVRTGSVQQDKQGVGLRRRLSDAHR